MDNVRQCKVRFWDRPRFHNETGDSWCHMRGYGDGTYKVYSIKRYCKDKTEFHNWSRYIKANYTNFLGTMYFEHIKRDKHGRIIKNL